MVVRGAPISGPVELLAGFRKIGVRVQWTPSGIYFPLPASRHREAFSELKAQVDQLPSGIDTLWAHLCPEGAGAALN
jgi:hypothetical protein